MEQKVKTCTEIIGDIISKYSNVRTGDTSTRIEYGKENSTVLEREKEFWGWFCENIKDQHFKQCFTETTRDDYCGSLAEIRKKYQEKCKG